jgi:cell division protein FtsI/penicillin-binding protein 2
MSSGVEQTKLRENQAQMQSPQQNPNSSNNNYNLNLIDNNIKPNTALAVNNIENKLKDINMEDYYKRFIPDYQSMYNSTPHTLPYTPPSSNTIQNQNTNTIQHQNTNTNFATTDVNKVLLDKLNYMINLLEQDQDEKTQSVMEEVILYCFLGVFIIFICDSFSKVGKYVR